MPESASQPANLGLTVGKGGSHRRQEWVSPLDQLKTPQSPDLGQKSFSNVGKVSSRDIEPETFRAYSQVLNSRFWNRCVG